jgi:hypothetical protein
VGIKTTETMEGINTVEEKVGTETAETIYIVDRRLKIGLQCQLKLGWAS